MTCKNCIHYNACSAKGGLFNEKDENKEMLCRHFQDKSWFVKIPVRFGDLVWKTRGKIPPTPGLVDRIEVLPDGLFRLHLINKGYCVWGVSGFSDAGGAYEAWDKEREEEMK